METVTTPGGASNRTPATAHVTRIVTGDEQTTPATIPQPIRGEITARMRSHSSQAETSGIETRDTTGRTGRYQREFVKAPRTSKTLPGYSDSTKIQSSAQRMTLPGHHSQSQFRPSQYLRLCTVQCSMSGTQLPLFG